MIVVARRIMEAKLEVNDELVSSIGQGLILYVGISVGDVKEDTESYAKKVANLRIFDGENSEASVKDIKGEILSVSQFTLSANTKKGNRPSFLNAMGGESAKPIFDYFNECLEKELGIKIPTGVFGTRMKITAVDDGPFTIILSKYDTLA